MNLASDATHGRLHSSIDNLERHVGGASATYDMETPLSPKPNGVIWWL
jgi:hypothetical protein